MHCHEMGANEDLCGVKVMMPGKGKRTFSNLGVIPIEETVYTR